MARRSDHRPPWVAANRRRGGSVVVAVAVLLGACDSAGVAPAGVNGNRPADAGPGIQAPDAPRGGSPEVGAVGLDAACVTQTSRGERVPLDLYIMLDASYSMADPAAGGMTKWDAIKAAIGSFLQDSAANDLAVGLQVFPQVRAQIPEDCFSDSMCAAFGPCRLARTCSPSDRVVLCKTDRDCGTAQTCIPLGTCSLSDKYCTQFGALCGGEGGVPAGNTCTQIPGYCEARDICESAPYANPTVPISVLPGATPSILAALGNRKPEGLTPTGPALTGAIEHARMRQRANPQRKAAVLLASDGFPSECMPATVSGVAAIAKEGLDGNPSVPTFAIGVVSREEMATATSSLSEIAIAGGTGKPFVINTAANVTADFQAALSAIRSNSLACEYKLPMSSSAGATDFTKVNVQMTRGNGSIETVVNVKDKAACDPERGGWYYDVPLGSSAQPSAILICPASCERLRAERTGQIDIVLGCRTVIE